MPLQPILRRFSSMAGICAATLGAMTIVGWAAGLPALQRLFLPGLPMSLNSALCFVVYGLALLLVGRAESPAARLTGRIMAGLMLAFILLSWIEISTGMRHVVNELVFPSDPASPPALAKGPFPLNSIIPNFLIGLGLLAIYHPRRTWLGFSSWLGLAVLGLALLTLTSLGLSLAGLGERPGLSTASALALAALGAGLTCARVNEDFLRIISPGHPLSRITWRLLILGVVTPLLLHLGLACLILDKIPALQPEVTLLTAILGVGLLGAFTYFLQRLSQVDEQRETAERTRDTLFARVQQQAANLQTEVASRIQELHVLHERMQFAVGSAGYGVWEFDFKTKRLTWDDRVLSLYGLTAADFKGGLDDWRARVHPEDLPRAEQASADVLSGRTSHYEAEFRIRRPDGKERHIRAIGYLQRDAGNRVRRMVGLDRDITRERAHASELAELNERLQLALRAEGGGVWDYNVSSGQETWDARQCEIYGVPPSEGRSCSHDYWRRFVHPEDLGRIKATEQITPESGDYLEHTFRIVRTDGEVRHIHTVGYVHRDASGQPTRIVGLDRDITDEVETRNKLLVTEERLGYALQASGEGMWDWNLASGQAYYSPRWLEMLGYSPDELQHTYATWETFIHPDDFAGALKALEDHCEGKTTVFHSEHRLRTKRGDWIWSLARGVIVRRDEQGRPLRIVGMQGDITARKLLEQQLRRNQESALQVGRLAQIGAWEIDVASGRISWDPEVYRIHGVELGFQPTFEAATSFYPPEARAVLTEALKRAEREGTPFDLELPCLTAQKQQLQVRVIGRAEMAAGRAVRLFGALQDITARFHAEQTRHHLETQLFQAQKMETLGTLAGGIAHDFNNLLTGIMGYQDLALDTITPEHPAHHFITASRDASFRARGLVDQILTFSRPAGASEPIPVDLAQVAEEARRFLRATLPATIDIQLDVAPGCGRVQADATQMHQVFLNLGSNAAHAMRSGGGTLRIALAPVRLGAAEAAAMGGVAAGPHVQLTISDTGHGIDPETLKRIFDPFFTTKGVGEGTGLGLSVVHGIIRAHHGAIQVRSAPGEGARFDIYLPVSEADPISDGDALRPQLHGRGETIIVVDDEELVATFTKSALERFGYRAMHFGTPDKCLQLLQGNPDGCAVLVTDQTMPGMTGMELSAQVRSFAPRLPIIVMSGYFSKISPGALSQIGHISLLAKPFSMEEIAAAVHRALHPDA